MIKYICLCYFTGYYNNQSTQFFPGQEIFAKEPVFSLEIAVTNGWALKEVIQKPTKDLNKPVKSKK